MKERVMKWLKNGKGTLNVERSVGEYIFMKVERNERLDFIFYQQSYNGGDIQMEDFHYAGIYDKESGRVYDECYELHPIAEEQERESATSFEGVNAEFVKRVREKINRRIRNDRSKLLIKDEEELGNKKENLIDERKYRIPSEARKLFLKGWTPEDVVFDSNYYKSNFTKDDFIDYIMDGDGAVEGAASKWIGENQEEMFIQFLVNDAVKEELERLAADKGNQIHAVKAIKEAVGGTDCVTVNVTSVINGRELTFKAKADEFRDGCDSQYWVWNIAAPDRKRFQELYGRNANYGPNDVVRITYAKRTLYSKPV